MFASDFRQLARKALQGKWGLAVGVGFIASLLGGAESGGGGVSFNFNIDSYNKSLQRFSEIDPATVQLILTYLGILLFITVIISLVYLVIGGAVQLGYCRFNLNLVDGKKAEFNDLFSGFHYFGKAFVLRLLTSLYILLWTLLFIIPGIIAAFSYAMAPYILAEHPELTASEALSQSKEIMEGNRFRLFCLRLSFIGWGVLCALSCGIGYLWLLPYEQAAQAAFYNQVSGKNSMPAAPEQPDDI